MRQRTRRHTRRADAAGIVWPRSHRLIEQSRPGLAGGLADALHVLDNMEPQWVDQPDLPGKARQGERRRCTARPSLLWTCPTGTAVGVVPPGLNAGITGLMEIGNGSSSWPGEMARPLWLADQPDDEPGSVARPYTITQGRTRPVGDEEIEVETLVWTTSLAASSPPRMSAHWRAVADMCQEVVSVAEVAARLGVPIGVARVLIGDMATAGLVYLQRPRHTSDHPDIGLLERVLHGLRQL